MRFLLDLLEAVIVGAMLALVWWLFDRWLGMAPIPGYSGSFFAAFCAAFVTRRHDRRWGL